MCKTTRHGNKQVIDETGHGAKRRGRGNRHVNTEHEKKPNKPRRT
jgi:hypothetical protein